MSNRYKSGPWYIWDHETQEFLVQSHIGCRTDSAKRHHPTRWTPSIKLAKAYKNPSLCEIRARQLRASGFPRAGMVTKEAARCLDEKRRRGDDIP